MPDIDPTGGQGGSAPVSQPGEGQGAAGGGSQPKDGGGGFNWELFPDVPEAQRPLLEPHLKQVQGHVTQMEQRYSPFKGILDSGVKAEDLQNLMNLDASFNQDPLRTWLMLGENMQKAGSMNDDLDLAQVKAILNGEELEEGDEGETKSPEGGDDMPPWAQKIVQRLDAQEETEKSSQEQVQTQQRQKQLTDAMGKMRGQLKEAGYEDTQLSDEMLTAAIIAHKGDADKALAELTGLRESVLKGFTDGKTTKPESGPEENDGGPAMPKGAPKSPKRTPRGPGREFADARAGATQMLESRLQAQAQED